VFSLVLTFALAVPPQSTLHATPQSTITQTFPCALCDVCQCKACNCPELEARLAKPPPLPKPPVVKQTVTTRTVLDHGYFTGHTHSCPNPNCPFRKTYGEPFTWSHQMNAGHNCPHCGAAQYVASNRPTTILREIPVANATPAKTAAQTITLATLQTSAASSSACANGQCSTAAAPARVGLFRRR